MQGNKAARARHEREQVLLNESLHRFLHEALAGDDSAKDGGGCTAAAPQRRRRLVPVVNEPFPCVAGVCGLCKVSYSDLFHHLHEEVHRKQLAEFSDRFSTAEC